MFMSAIGITLALLQMSVVIVLFPEWKRKRRKNRLTNTNEMKLSYIHTVTMKRCVRYVTFTFWFLQQMITSKWFIHTHCASYVHLKNNIKTRYTFNVTRLNFTIFATIEKSIMLLQTMKEKNAIRFGFESWSRFFGKITHTRTTERCNCVTYVRTFYKFT